MFMAVCGGHVELRDHTVDTSTAVVFSYLVLAFSFYLNRALHPLFSCSSKFCVVSWAFPKIPATLGRAMAGSELGKCTDPG